MTKRFLTGKACLLFFCLTSLLLGSSTDMSGMADESSKPPHENNSTFFPEVPAEPAASPKTYPDAASPESHPPPDPTALDSESAKFALAPTPAWVKILDLPLDPIPLKPSQLHHQHLLCDNQWHVEEKTYYQHQVIKILNSTGVSNHSQLYFNFSPAYQKIAVHAIRVFRDGKWHDRIENSRHELIQREQRLESNQYDGELSLVYFLSDIRVGDVLEYAWSRTGEDPLFSTFHSDTFYVELHDILEQLHYRVLFHPHRSFAIKSFATQVEHRLTDLSPELRELSWEILSSEPRPREDRVPAWYIPFAHVQISEYKSWQEIAQIAAPLYQLSEDFIAHPSPEITALVAQWKSSTQDPSERALKALRFVQDEIRYLGFEEGIGAVKPTDPRVVFERRFGDCKDKTFLLHAFLHLMDIPSTPVLVHSSLGRKLPDTLPRPSAFNHAILRIDLANCDKSNDHETADSKIWVDPTYSLQGGSLRNTFFPDYHRGLPLGDKSEGLISLPQPIYKKPTEIETYYILHERDSAEIFVKTTFYGSSADHMRSYLQNNSLQEVAKNYIRGLQKKYGAAKALQPLSYVDDRQNNMLVLTESYRVPTLDRAGKKVLKIYSFTVEEFLERNISLERSYPLALSYPKWVKERITIKNFIKNRRDTDRKGVEKVAENEPLILTQGSVHYSQGSKIKGKLAEFDYELKHLKDHLPVEDLQRYWQLLDKIDQKGRLEWIVEAAP